MSSADAGTPAATRERGRAGLRRSSLLTLVIGVVAVSSGVFTYLSLSGLGPIAPTPTLVWTLLVANFALGLGLVALIAWRLAGIWVDRRHRLPAANLRLRLVGLFAAVAIVPAVLVALFAALSLSLGLESWFSDRVRTSLENAVSVARSYVREHAENIGGDALLIAREVNRAEPMFREDRARFQVLLTRIVTVRNLDALVLVDEAGTNLLSVSKLDDFGAPTPEEIERAKSGEGVIRVDVAEDRVRALVRLDAYQGVFLYLVRALAQDVLEAQQNTLRAFAEYEAMERNRSDVMFTFAAVYGFVGVIVLLGAILVGMWIANRLADPVSRLILAADRVTHGDFTARVLVENRRDEMAMLADAFNRMTAEVESRRDALVQANEELDDRRRFTEAVLGGVTAGVIGVDPEGVITVANRSAHRLLDSDTDIAGRRLADLAPEMAALVTAAQDAPDQRSDGHIELSRSSQTRHFTVRVAAEIGEEGAPSFVVTFDDTTDLIAAQRVAAWSDVARRIAHEIKNPLTPIQLSAERLRRKYAREITTDPEIFEQCTATIVRQVSDIGRMVDEFSAFARMPAPVFAPADLGAIIAEAVFSQKVANSGIAYVFERPETPCIMACDARLIGQALTNLLKNAAEAVEARVRADGATEISGRIETVLTRGPEGFVVTIADDGIGLPDADRSRLAEPYVTTRDKGTGLGLAIVKKVIEDHGGRLEMDDAPARDLRGQTRAHGALMRIVLPDMSNTDHSGTDPEGNRVHEQV